MSQSRKKRNKDRLAEKVPDSETASSRQQGRRTAFLIISVVIVIIAIAVGIFYYQEYVAPFRRTIITVDNTKIDMGYFLKRAQLSAADPMDMLDMIVREQLVKQVAPRVVGEITTEDIDRELRLLASGGSGNITDSEYKEWYRQQLNESGLSESEFTEIMGTNLLMFRFHEYLAERVPTVGEQAYLHVIQLETYEDAEKVRARWEAGEDFADLAREFSLDPSAEDEPGDIGWVGRGVLSGGLDYAAFNLDIGEVSQPMQLEAEGAILLVMVSERAVAREYDEMSLGVIKGNALQAWFAEEVQLHDIEYNFNSEIYAWLNWQLSKN